MGLGSALGSLGGALGPIGGVVGPLIGGIYDQEQNKKLSQHEFNQNAALQKEFAKFGVRWKVKDAREAGINPLVALGAQTHSATPITTGIESTLGRNLGQDISRAINKMQTAEQRQASKLELESRALDNDLKRAQLNNLNRAGSDGNNTNNTSPPLPKTNATGGVKMVPKEVTSSVKGMPWVEAGANPAFALHQRDKNKYFVTLSESMKTAVEDSPQEVVAQSILAIEGGMQKKRPAPKGFRWKYNKATQTLYLENIRAKNINSYVNKSKAKHRRTGRLMRQGSKGNKLRYIKEIY